MDSSFTSELVATGCGRNANAAEAPEAVLATGCILAIAKPFSLPRGLTGDAFSDCTAAYRDFRERLRMIRNMMRRPRSAPMAAHPIPSPAAVAGYMLLLM